MGISKGRNVVIGTRKAGITTTSKMAGQESEFIPWEVLFGDEDKKTLDASVFQDEPSNTFDALQHLLKADEDANVATDNLKAQIADVYKQIQAKQAEKAAQQETAKQQSSVGEQKKIFEGRARRWAPAVDAAVADKLAGRLKPLNDPEPGVVGESQKGGLHEYFGAGWANTDLNNIDALRRELGVAPYSPPDEVIDALQKQPVSQRLYALTAEGAEFEDKSWSSLSELFSNTRLGVLPDERIESAIASFEGYPGAENLSNAEKAALYFYTRSSWTDAVNNYLRKLDRVSVSLMKQKARGGDTEYVESELKLLMTDPSYKQTRQVATLMMNGLAKLIAARQAHGGKPLMATRGAGSDAFRVGEQDAVYDAAFMSTANMPSHMSEFSNSAKVNMVLFSNQGVNIAPFSGYSNEKEILMFPGTMFNVDMMLEPGYNQLLVLRELVDGEPIDAASLRPQEQKTETGVGWAINNAGRRYKAPVIEEALKAKVDKEAMQRQVLRLKKLLARIDQGAIAPGGIQQGGADYMDLKHLVDSIGDQPEWQSSVPGLEEFLLNSEIGSQGIDIDIINAYVDGQLGRKLVDWAATKKGNVSAREMELLLLADTLSSARNSFFKNLYDYSDGKRSLVIEQAIARALTRPGQQNADARQWWGETIEQYADAVGVNVQSLPLEWQQLVSEAQQGLDAQWKEMVS